MNMFRMIDRVQARRLLPGRNRCRQERARSIVSWTRSSASEGFRSRPMAWSQRKPRNPATSKANRSDILLRGRQKVGYASPRPTESGGSPERRHDGRVRDVDLDLTAHQQEQRFHLAGVDVELVAYELLHPREDGAGGTLDPAGHGR